MKQKEEFFLPMMHEATNRFLQHLTVEVAKPIFELLKYRSKHSLSEDVLYEKFKQVIIEEQAYQYYLSRMRMELEQLFEFTSPYTHKKIRRQINSLPPVLEKIIERKSVIKRLKESNKCAVETIYLPDGNFHLEPVPRKKEILDLTLLSSPYLDEYIAILNSMLFYFKDTVAVFDGNEMNKLANKEPAPPVSEYLAPPIKRFTLNWKRFLDLCYTYSRINIEWAYRNEPVIECLNKVDGKYLWKADLPMLGEFITMLEKDEIKIIRPQMKKNELAELFLKFFGLAETFPNPHFLSLKIRPVSPPKKFFFADMKRVIPLT